jgi:hypothetical protein
MSMKTARQLFERFFDREPSKDELRTVSLPSQVDGALIGKITRLTYRPTGDDTEYEHAFDEGEEPTLFVSDDGRLFLPIDGDYEFTPKGFEG